MEDAQHQPSGAGKGLLRLVHNSVVSIQNFVLLVIAILITFPGLTLISHNLINLSDGCPRRRQR